MATKPRKVNRATFGSVRKLPSGRWQARYPDEAGRPMTAPGTFDTADAAWTHIAGVRADRSRGSYIDPRDGAQTFDAYAREWIETGGTRGKLAPRTADMYRDILTRQLSRFDGVPLNQITPKAVRDWYATTRRTLAAAAKVRGNSGETRLRQSYALLSSLMNSAVRDRLITSSPCGIVGAGSARSPERPHLTAQDLAAIVSMMPAHYAQPLRLMFAAHLRVGELIGLERGDYDAAQGVLRVERQVVQTSAGSVITETKTGTARAVTLPPSAADALSAHLFSSTGLPRSPMFTRPDGMPISRGGIQQAWGKAARAAGQTGVHLHDVRHAGLTLAAQAGATTRELMDRAGHRTTAAAMIYQHVANERRATVAEAMDALLGVRNQAASGTAMARTDVSDAQGEKRRLRGIEA